MSVLSDLGCIVGHAQARLRGFKANQTRLLQPLRYGEQAPRQHDLPADQVDCTGVQGHHPSRVQLDGTSCHGPEGVERLEQASTGQAEASPADETRCLRGSSAKDKEEDVHYHELVDLLGVASAD